jgi:phosphoketolase
LGAWWRAANYLSVGQIYLMSNALLTEPLGPEHVKPRLLGHWGTTPGLNLLYAHLNRIIASNDKDVIFVTGPGHGGPGLLASVWLEGTYSEVYPSLSQDAEGMERLFRQFSFSGFIDHVVNKTAHVTRVYLPPDTNTLLSVDDHCLRSNNLVNVIVAGKQPCRDWLSIEDAILHCTRGLGVWDWASTDERGEPDVVLACAGDIPTLETLAAADLLRRNLPELKVRVVNVVDLMRLEPDTEHPHGLADRDFDTIFTTDKPIIFAYHGYPWLVHRLAYRRTNHRNLHVRGYKEEGTRTTPFDMVMMNDMDRYHLVMDVIDRVPELGETAASFRQEMSDMRVKARAWTREYGEDLPEVANWTWPH